MSLSLFNYAISSSFSSSAGNIYTSSIVSITGVTSGSITFTPAFAAFNNYASASLLWLSGSVSPGPFYNISGGYITNVDTQAFSSSFSFSNSTTLVTQSNSSFYFDSSSIVGYPNSQFQIVYFTSSATANQTLVVDRVVDFYIDTGSGENAVSFKNLIYNTSTQNYDFETYTSIKGGIETTAKGTGSFAVGTSSLAQGNASVAEGIGTLASGFASHAAGINTTASGQAAFSMGIETDAEGTASFAAGTGSLAKGEASVAMGIGTIASASGQVTIGHYNFPLDTPDNLFVVGGGTGPSVSNRGNLLTVVGGIGSTYKAVKIDVGTNFNSNIIPGFSIYGNTTFQGNITGSTRTGGSNIVIYDDTYNAINSTSSFSVIDADRVTYTNPDLAKITINRFGINFELSNNISSPGSTYLWTTPLGLLYYGSNAIILNGGNTLGGAMTIGTNDTNNLQLETNNSTRVFISSSGNVGIGTITPTLATLQIQGNVSASSYTGSFFGTSSWAINALTASFVNTASTNAFVQGGNSFGTTALLGTNDNQNLQFETSGSVRMTISSSGNVGIGITPPQRRLHIDASGSSNTFTPLILTSVDTNNRVGIQFASSSIASGRTNSLYHRMNAATAEWILSANAGENGAWQFLPRDDSSYVVSMLAPFNGGTARIFTGQSQSLFALGAGSSANHLVISSSGQIGVNTNAPAALLHVNGTAASTSLFRVNSGSAIIQNNALQSNRSASVAFFTTTGNPTANFDFDIGSTGTANAGTARIAGAGTTYSFSSNGSIVRNSTGNTEMFSMVMGGTAVTGIQNPLRIQFDATQTATSGSGYIVLRLNATHASTAGTGSKLLQTWEFANVQRSVVDISGSIGIGMTGSVPLSASLHISGANTANLLRIQSPASSSILFVSGSGNIGMGLTVPSAQLHISGASNSVLFEIDSPVQNNILFVTGSGRVGINTSSSLATGLSIFQQSSSFMDPTTAPTGSGLYVFSSGSGNTQPSIHVQNIGDAFASINLSTISGSTNPLRMWSLSKRNNANANALQLYYYNGTTYSFPLFNFIQNGVSTLGESTQIQLDDLNGFVGLQTTPTEWIHLSSDPASSNYILINADQTSNPPPLTTASTAKNGYGIVGNENYLAEPDYWMEIKLGAAGPGIVLIPCYLPA